MEFKKITINNFCGIKEFSTDLYHNTIIKGQNAVGKSTIRNAIFWVLFDKMSDGTSADSIRPHNESGIDENYIDISVELATEIDGKEITFKKTQKQNWVKDRTTHENVFKGNVNDFEINGIPKKLADYKAFIEENITSIDKLMLCVNPFIFLNLDTKKRRAKLFEMVEDFSDEDVITTDERFNGITNDLAVGSIDDLIARSRKIINSKKKDLELIPARIDELNKQIHYEDLAEWELAKNLCKEKLSEISKKKQSYSLIIEEHEKISADILKLQMDLNEIKQKSFKTIADKRNALMNEITQKKSIKQNFECDIKEAERSIEIDKDSLKMLNGEIKECREEYTKVKSMEYNKDDLVCKFCGQELPEDKRESILADFEDKRKNKLEIITKCGNDLKKRIDEINEDIVRKQELIEKLNAELPKLIKEIETVNTEYDNLPNDVDMSSNEEYQKVEKLIADKQKILEKSEGDSLNVELTKEENRYNAELIEIEKKLTCNDFNVELEKRIEELKVEQKETAQLILTEEGKLDLLQDFQKAKIGLITDKINAYFGIVKFRLFKQLINGGFEEVCEPIYNGTSYDKTLNHGAKILCEIDICKGFQKANKVAFPVIIDDSESVDGDKIPTLDTQLISIRRTDDSKLTVEEF